MANVVGGVTWNQATSESVTLAALPLFHVTGMQGSMNAPIYRGATCRADDALESRHGGAVIQRYRVPVGATSAR